MSTEVRVRFADRAVAKVATYAAGTVAGVVRVVGTDVAPDGAEIALRIVVRADPPPLTVATTVVRAVRDALLSSGAEASAEVGVTLVDVEP